MYIRHEDIADGSKKASDFPSGKKLGKSMAYAKQSTRRRKGKKAAQQKSLRGRPRA